MGKKAGMASSLRHWRATITDGNANDGATKAKATQWDAAGSVDVDVDDKMSVEIDCASQNAMLEKNTRYVSAEEA